MARPTTDSSEEQREFAAYAGVVLVRQVQCRLAKYDATAAIAVARPKLVSGPRLSAKWKRLDSAIVRAKAARTDDAELRDLVNRCSKVA